jgi:hypothetical protein
MEKTFTLEQVLDLLCSMEQAISPDLFTSSQGLDTFDFLDLPLCKAQELEIEDEFKTYMNTNPNFNESY